MTELESLVVRLIGDGSAYQQMLSQAQTATQNFASMTAGILADVGLSFGLLSTAIKGVQQAAGAETTLTDMKVLLGSAEQAKKLLGDLREFSEGTPLRMGTLVNSSKMLMQMGVEAKNIVPIMRLLGDASGGSAEKLESMARIMGRVISSGRITGHEVRLLTIAGFNPMKDLAAVTGKSVAELTEQMHKGGIGADLLIQAFQHADREGGTFFGRLAEGSQTLGGLFSTMQDNVSRIITEIGKVIVEGLDLKTVVRNVTEGAKLIITWLQSISPESKRVIGIVISVAAGIGVLSFALLALGPVIGLVGTALGPVVALLGAIPALIGFILTPVGAVIAALVALGVAVMYWAGTGGKILGWFGDRWKDLKESVGPGIKGIKDAIAAGNLELAFKISWAQIKLTFAQGTEGMRELWVGFVLLVREVWADTVESVQKTWHNTTGAVSASILILKQNMGLISPQELLQQTEDLVREGGAAYREIEKARKADYQSAQNDAMKNMEGIKGELKDLLKERDRLVAQAAKEAANVKPKVKVDTDIDLSKLTPPAQKMHVTPIVHWEAALRDSVEAASRISSYFDMLREMPGAGLGGHGAGHTRGGVEALGAGSAASAAALGLPPSAPLPNLPSVPVGAAAPAGAPSQDRVVELLSRIADSNDLMAKRGSGGGRPAGLKA
jgi:tape measure domain-containing protein